MFISSSLPSPDHLPFCVLCHLTFSQDCTHELEIQRVNGQIFVNQAHWGLRNRNWLGATATPTENSFRHHNHAQVKLIFL